MFPNLALLSFFQSAPLDALISLFPYTFYLLSLFWNIVFGFDPMWGVLLTVIQGHNVSWPRKHPVEHIATFTGYKGCIPVLHCGNIAQNVFLLVYIFSFLQEITAFYGVEYRGVKHVISTFCPPCHPKLHKGISNIFFSPFSFSQALSCSCLTATSSQQLLHFHLILNLKLFVHSPCMPYFYLNVSRRLELPKHFHSPGK